MQGAILILGINQPQLIHIHLHGALQGALAPAIHPPQRRVPVVLDGIACAPRQCLRAKHPSLSSPMPAVPFSKPLASVYGEACRLPDTGM